MSTKPSIATLSDESPCVRNCCLDTDNVCLGCGRSLAEILEWHHADNQRRKTIRQHAKSRLDTRFACAQLSGSSFSR